MLTSITVEWWTIGPLLAGGLLVALARLLAQRRRRWWWVAPVWLLALVLLTTGGYSLWYHHRPQPADVAMRPLQPGMTYQRIVRTAPRPVVVHLVRIDLTTPGLRFFVTPPDPQIGDGQVRARTTSQFLEAFDLHVALNASFFTPWHANPPLSYYPHAGDPVRVLGPTMSDGVSFGRDEPHYIPLAISADNRVTIGAIPPDARHVVSGLHMLLEHGQPVAPQHGWAKPDEPSPRSAIALVPPAANSGWSRWTAGRPTSAKASRSWNWQACSATWAPTPLSTSMAAAQPHSATAHPPALSRCSTTPSTSASHQAVNAPSRRTWARPSTRHHEP